MTDLMAGGLTVSDDHISIVRTITVEHSSDTTSYRDRTVISLGSSELLDLVTTNVASRDRKRVPR